MFRKKGEQQNGRHSILQNQPVAARGAWHQHTTTRTSTTGETRSSGGGDDADGDGGGEDGSIEPAQRQEEQAQGAGITNVRRWNAAKGQYGCWRRWAGAGTHACRSIVRCLRLATSTLTVGDDMDYDSDNFGW